MSRATHHFGVAALAAGLLAGCGSSGGGDASTTSTKPAAAAAPAGGAVKIAIKDFKYDPAAVTVKAGTKITWINEDSAPHTSTAKGALPFDTGTLNEGQSKTLTLSKPGTYAYICSFHPFMKATVTVK